MSDHVAEIMRIRRERPDLGFLECRTLYEERRGSLLTRAESDEVMNHWLETRDS